MEGHVEELEEQIGVRRSYDVVVQWPYCCLPGH